MRRHILSYRKGGHRLHQPAHLKHRSCIKDTVTLRQPDGTLARIGVRKDERGRVVASSLRRRWRLVPTTTYTQIHDHLHHLWTEGWSLCMCVCVWVYTRTHVSYRRPSSKSIHPPAFVKTAPLTSSFQMRSILCQVLSAREEEELRVRVMGSPPRSSSSTGRP